MTDELRMDAYYFGFKSTGVREIDLIISAVACAGKAYHFTEDWNDKTDSGYEPHEGESPVDWIQMAANKAAEAWNKRSEIPKDEPLPDDEMITIHKDVYEERSDDSLFLQCLKNAGVDNWDGYEIAQDQYRELKS